MTPKPFTHRDAVAYRPLDWTGEYPPTYPKGAVPEHVAIVMDGNGRWANRQGLTRVEAEPDFESGREGVRTAHGVAPTAVLCANHHRESW